VRRLCRHGVEQVAFMLSHEEHAYRDGTIGTVHQLFDIYCLTCLMWMCLVDKLHDVTRFLNIFLHEFTY
jgi:hypothetical protein